MHTYIHMCVFMYKYIYIQGMLYINNNRIKINMSISVHRNV